MLSIAIGTLFIIITGFILKKVKQDLAMFESEILLSFENKENEISESYKAINIALENKQNIDV